MHTVWKGAISFGLVHVPVKMFSATEEKDIHMKYVHRKCITPLSYVRKCPTCDQEVAWEDIVRGYEYEPGRFVLFEKDELERLTEAAGKEIKILDFVNLSDIDPIYFQKTYYLAPNETGTNAYNLLLSAMRDTGKIGIAKVSIRSKSSLAAIRIIDNCLAMATIFYPDEIRPIAQVPGLPERVTADGKELEMAKMLIEHLSSPFEPEKYTDDYRHALLDAIRHKVAGEEVQTAPEPQKTNVIDLMAALQASLESMRPAAADDAGTAPAGRKKAAAAGADAAGGAAGAKPKAGKKSKAKNVVS
jgi:DNA end-binding protein Ku